MVRSLKANKKGVSPIIATLLLIVIAVAAAVVTYAFVTGFIGTSSSAAPQQGSMSFDSYYITVNVSGNDTCTAYLRNTGYKPLTIDKAYIDGAPMDFTGTASFTPNTTTTIVVNSNINLGGGVGHQLRVVATDGTPLQFIIVKTT